MRTLLFFLALAPAAALAEAWVSPADLAAIRPADLVEIRAAIERETQVKSEACAVYRPASVRFRDLMLFGPEVVQQVQVTDRAGGVWLAYYAMRREQDGRWRASGCRLVQPNRTISA